MDHHGNSIFIPYDAPTDCRSICFYIPSMKEKPSEYILVEILWLLLLSNGNVLQNWAWQMLRVTETFSYSIRTKIIGHQEEFPFSSLVLMENKSTLLKVLLVVFTEMLHFPT